MISFAIIMALAKVHSFLCVKLLKISVRLGTVSAKSITTTLICFVKSPFQWAYWQDII